MNRSAVVLTVTAAFVVAACGCRRGESYHDGLTVAVSIEPQRKLAEDIAGHRARVITLFSSGGDPETYDPSLSSLMRLSSSDAYIRLGTLPFETNLLERLDNMLPRTFDVSEGIQLIEGTHGEEDHDEAGHTHSHMYDPHIWSSVRNARIMAANIAAALEEIDPDGKDYYRHRLDSLTTVLDSADSLFAARLKTSSAGEFMVWHPSLSYFARDYNLHQHAVGSENKEISVRKLYNSIVGAQGAGRTVFFAQPGFDPPLVSTVRGNVEAYCVDIDPLDYDWLGQLTKAVDAMASAPGN